VDILVLCCKMSKYAKLSEDKGLKVKSNSEESEFKVPPVPKRPVLPKLSKKTVEEFTRVFVKINLLNWDEVVKKFFELNEGREKELLRSTVR